MEILYKWRRLGFYGHQQGDPPSAGPTRGREQSLPDDDEGRSPDLRHPLQRDPRRSHAPCGPSGGASTYLPLSRSHIVARVQGNGLTIEAF
jgi:hypothetical protein